MSDIRDVVVPLYERRGPIWKGLGTASIISSSDRCAIILTARHVLEAVVDEVDQAKPPYPKLSGVCAMVRSVGEDSFIAEIHQIQISDFSDLAFAVLIAPEGKRFGPRLSVDPSPVRCGTSVTAVGYLGLPVNCDVDWEREHFSVRMEFRVDAREASVLERRPGGSRRLTWPVFKVATAFDSGMSGGPIFDVRDGEPVIRGVICSDMTIGVDIEKGSGQEAWASEIWPILMTPYRFDLEFFEDNGDRISVNTILDLFREGFVIDRGDTVQNLLWEVNGDTVRAGWRGIPEFHVASLE